MADDKEVPNSVVPPAEEKHTAPKETVFGKEPAEGVPVSTSGPVSEEKVQSALSAVPDPKTDDTADDAPKTANAKELKEDVGGAEAAPIAGSRGKPAPTQTVEEAAKEKEEGTKETEPSGESKPEESKTAEEAAKPKDKKEAPTANGAAADADEKGEPAEEAQPGEKRAAVTNGGKEDGPAKKAKTGAAPTTNGRTGRGTGKREKKQPAPVGKTARRTRSQGLAEV